MELVQSSVTEEITADVEAATPARPEPSPEAVEQTRKLMAFYKAFNEGTLTFAQYKMLRKPEQKRYARRFGRPAMPNDVRHREKVQITRLRRAKMARASRKANRRRSR
jgi:hypothetical protein